MRCRAATPAAIVEGPGFPLSMTDGREKQKLKEEEDERMQDAIPPPALYKGSGLGLGRPTRPIKIRKAQGARTDPPPQPARPDFPPPPFATPSAWETSGRRSEPRGRVRRPLPTP